MDAVELAEQFDKDGTVTAVIHFGVYIYTEFFRIFLQLLEKNRKFSNSCM